MAELISHYWMQNSHSPLQLGNGHIFYKATMCKSGAHWIQSGNGWQSIVSAVPGAAGGAISSFQGKQRQRYTKSVQLAGQGIVVSVPNREATMSTVFATLCCSSCCLTPATVWGYFHDPFKKCHFCVSGPDWFLLHAELIQGHSGEKNIKMT